MADLTKAQLAGELNNRVVELEKALTEYRSVTDFRLDLLEKQLAERIKAEERVGDKITDLAAKNAVVEEKCRVSERLLEKQGDRGWNLTQALLILLLSVLLSAVTSTLAQFLLKK